MAASLPNSQHMQHRYHLPALAMKDKISTSSVRNAPSHNDNLPVKVAADVHDRTHTRTLELIQKAEATLRTYSRSSRPFQPNVERRRSTKRRHRLQRRPPKTSTFHFERRRREKQWAGYEADIEFDHQEYDTIANDMALNAGIFPFIDSSGTSLPADHSIQPTNYERQQHLTPTRFSPNSHQNTVENASVGTTATMASTISASSTVPARHLPFRVGTDPSSPFTLSETALTMSQAIALSHHAHMIVDAKSPFIVKHVNAAFCRILNSYGVSSDVLGEPLLKSSQGQNETHPVVAQQGSLQQIIFGAKRIVLFPIVSDHGGSFHGWEFHAPGVHHNFGTRTGIAEGIINHFLIQIVDENLQSNFMQVIA